MEFCVISPAIGLKQYATRSRTHLILAQVQNQQYRNFYKARKEAGDFLILDNGAYEEGKATSTLIEAMRWYTPDVVVLPDLYLGNWEDSLNASLGFAQDCSAHREEYVLDRQTWTWMFVPQAEPGDKNGWHHCLEAGIKRLVSPTRTLALPWIGLSRNMVNDARGTVFSSKLARVWEAAMLKLRGYNVHALGMQHGCLEELWALNQAGCNSCDSSAPVWRGWNSHLLKDEWSGPACAFDHEVYPSFSERLLIEQNLAEVLRQCS